MSTNLNSKELLNSKIEKLISEVELAGSWTIPFKKAMNSGMPQNFSTGTYYRGANIFFLWLEAMDKNYSSNQWLTMKQCNTLKGKVLKGSKATPIFFFKPIEVKTDEVKEGENVKKMIPMLKVFYVFNIEQTTIKSDEIFEANNSTIETCEEFFSSLKFVDIKEDKEPFYTPTADYIGMPIIDKFISSEEYYTTLGHEFIHATGHPTRLNRDMNSSYAYEELIAELGSAFVSAHLGIDTEPLQDNCKAYLKEWLKSLANDKKYLWKAMNEASKAFNYLLDALVIEAKKAA